MIDNCLVFFFLIALIIGLPIFLGLSLTRKNRKWYKFCTIFPVASIFIIGIAIYVFSDVLDFNCYCTVFTLKLDFLLVLSAYFFIAIVPLFLMLLAGVVFWFLDYRSMKNK